MSLPLIALSGIVIVSVALSVYWSILSYRRFKLNELVADELAHLVDQTAKAIQAAKKITAGPTNGLNAAFMETPELLASIVTVLVNKFGDTRLGMRDFMIADSEYVSVYVNTTTQEIILSLNHDLQDSDAETTIMGFGSTDDNTFH